MTVPRRVISSIFVVPLLACTFDALGVGLGGEIESTSSTGSSTEAPTSTTSPTTTTITTTSSATTSDASTSATGDGVCGDGTLDPGEECDNGPANADSAPCTSSCTKAFCGDGLVGPGEGCDDANDVNGDGCSTVCILENCGDDLVQDGEECDDGPLNGPGKACNALCKLNICGDGDVGPAEMCDDGNVDPGDECTDACQPATCGDGVVQVDVEACDDGNQDNTDGCVGDCKLAGCGDGFVQAGMEACDDGNQDNTDECVGDCELATCGDGFVQAGVEQCDDNNQSDGDGCSSSCKNEWRRVFVTSEKYTGNLGGVSGADSICQGLAMNLGGTWKAWITADMGPDSSPAARFTQHSGRYVLVDEGKTKIADDWADLVDGSLDHAISVYETGEDAGGEAKVWSNTVIAGNSFVDTLDCNGWTSNMNNVQGRQGDRTKLDGKWTHEMPTESCEKTRRLYCFEQ